MAVVLEGSPPVLDQPPSDQVLSCSSYGCPFPPTALNAKAGKLRLGGLDGLFTYHDPCDLGRVSGIYDAPRSVIGAVPGIRYVELEESRQYSACCGSGGDLLASDQNLSLAAAGRRLDHVERSGAATIVTACPSCIRGMIMSKTAAKRPVNIMDITQLVWKTVNTKKEGA